MSTVPNELKASTRNMQEQMLACRPIDVISFAMRYYGDERAPNPSCAHAIHTLPFLLQDPESFRSAVCTIFCAEQASTSSKGGGKLLTSDTVDVSVLRQVMRAAIAANTSSLPASSSSSSSSSSAAAAAASAAAASSSSSSSSLSSASLDQQQQQEVAVEQPVFDPDKWQLDVIDEALRESMSKLDAFNFEAFVVVLRLHLSCWTVLHWVNEKLHSPSNKGDGVSASHLLTLHSSLKKFKSNSTSSSWRQITHPLRQEPLPMEDARLLVRLLTSALAANHTSIKQIASLVLRGWLANLSTRGAGGAAESSGGGGVGVSSPV